jgi:hypothetical protein
MALHGVLHGMSSFLLPRLANLIGRKYVMTSVIIGLTASYVGFLFWTPSEGGLPQMMGIIATQGLLEGGLCTLQVGKFALFVSWFVYSRTSNVSAIWRLSSLPVTGLQI